MISILIVDDHPVVRDGLRGMVNTEPDLDVVGEAGSGAEAVELARSLRPDVVLMDLRMPGLDGTGATGLIRAEVPTAHVVVLTTYDTDADILRAVEAGAVGYLLKDATRAELTAAIRAASRGETVLAPSVAGRLVKQVRQPSQRDAETDAIDTLLKGGGVCRDFAHLVAALCRPVDIPARVTSVYAPGLSPMDFHAVVETALDHVWQAVGSHPPGPAGGARANSHRPRCGRHGLRHRPHRSEGADGTRDHRCDRRRSSPR